MKKIKTFFPYEIKRLFGKRKGVILLVFLIISLLLVQNGVSNYKERLSDIDVFKETERLKVGQYINYRQYGTYGFRTTHLPAPISLFFVNSNVVPEMTSVVDSGERLNIYHSLKGKNPYALRKSGFADFSGFLFFFGTLLALLYGYGTFNSFKYIRFLSTLTPRSRDRSVFISLMVTRIILLFLIQLFFFCSAFILTIINGVSLPLNAAAIFFFLEMFLANSIFFVFGTITGTIGSRIKGGSIALICWIFLLFLLPEALNFYISKRAGHITPVYKLEQEKQKIVMDFEKRAIKKVGIFNNGKKVENSRRKVMLSYISNEVKQIRALEVGMRDEMTGIANHYHWLSIIFPTTFYRSVSEEVSSEGFLNLMDYYRYVEDLKWGFVNFYVEKVYFSNFTKVEPYKAPGELIYQAGSRLPGTFFYGLVLNLFYFFVLMWVSYGRFKKVLYQEPKKEVTSDFEMTIDLSGKKYEILEIYGEDSRERVFNLLRGIRSENNVKKFSGVFFMDNTDILTHSKKLDLLYLCPTETIPEDIRAIELFRLISRLTGARCAEFPLPLETNKTETFGQLEPEDQGLLLMSALDLRKSKLYVVDDLCKGKQFDIWAAFKGRMEELCEEGSKVLYMATQLIPSMREQTISPGFCINDYWSQRINLFKARSERKIKPSGYEL